MPWTIFGGVIIASPNGCFSHARLQHLDRIVENRAGFTSIPLFVEDPGFPPTLAHWRVTLERPVICSRGCPGCVGDCIRKPSSSMLPRVPSSVPDQCTIAHMTIATLIQQLISSFETTFSSTAVISVHQLFSLDMVNPAVCSSIVSPLDTYDIHSGFLCILQDPLFGPHSYFYVS